MSSIEKEPAKLANELFLKISNDPALNIQNDAQWPRDIELELDKISGPDSESFRLYFWLRMTKLFKEYEKANNIWCHKGQHYWNIGWIYFHKSDIDRAVKYIKKAADEDRKRDQSSLSAAIMVSGVLFPLREDINAFAKKTQNADAIRQFAQFVVDKHNEIIQGKFWRISDFNFLNRRALRNIFVERYNEVGKIISTHISPTYYGCIFTIGSMIEIMLDQLFQQNKSQIWKEYVALFPDKKVYKCGNCKVQKTIKNPDAYPPDVMLGEKISYLEKLIANKKATIPDQIIIPIILMQKYRNLIHPINSIKRPEYTPNRYTATFLFSAFAHIAHYWWPKNQLKIK